MVRVKWEMSIGYPMAKKNGEVEIPDEELEGKTEEEKDEIISEAVWEDAIQYVETYWEVVE